MTALLSATGVGKRYFLGRSKQGRPEARPWWRPSSWRRQAKSQREFWALKNVSFDLAPGQVLGVVGPNGAGKSTLLKIIAKVTHPTEGRIVGRGRVVSLIELGAGLNPDLTARENIFMNAAMHGIARHEVRARLDEIVAFAEIDRFLDSPLRHYSSGMYLRLAFSVAINLRPAILLADEVLAVGDLSFQERCLQRVEEESRNGLGVMFVSHDLTAVHRLCKQVLWLNGGRLAGLGPADDILPQYREAALGAVKVRSADGSTDSGPHVNRLAEIVSTQLVDSEGRTVSAAPAHERVGLRVRVRTLRAGVRLRCTLDVRAKGQLLFRTTQPDDLVADDRATYDLLVRLPADVLAPITYSVDVWIDTYGEKEGAVALPNALTFMGIGPVTGEGTEYKGALLAPRLPWTATRLDRATAKIAIG
jgi:lipopolysaccharide transport system ATP-binding protein